MSHNITSLQNVSQTCKAMSNFAAETRSLIVHTKETKLYKNVYVDENQTADETTPKLKSRSVAIKNGLATAAVTNAGDPLTLGDIIAASCRPTSFTLVDIHDYDYSNVITTVTSTTTNFIDDPDRVTPVVACVNYTAATDAINYITGTAPVSTTPTCEYYMKNKSVSSAVVFIDGGGNDIYECLKCPIGNYGEISYKSTKKRNDVTLTTPIT